MAEVARFVGEEPRDRGFEVHVAASSTISARSGRRMPRRNRTYVTTNATASDSSTYFMRSCRGGYAEHLGALAEQ